MRSRGWGLPRWWRRSRFSNAWWCCDWCDHGRCSIDPEHCRARCIHIGCGVSAGVIDWPDS